MLLKRPSQQRMESSTDPPIITTLVDALAESQALVRRLREEIEQLKQQNQHLQQGLELPRTAQEPSPSNQEISAQFEIFFQKDVGQQAQIDLLNKELAALRRKERKWLVQHPRVRSQPQISTQEVVVPSSSPALSPSRPLPSIVARLPIDEPASSPLPVTKPRRESSPPRKRLRASSSNDVPLQDVANHQQNRRRAVLSSKDKSSRAVKAIPIVTEDGEDHSRQEDGVAKQHKASTRRDEKAQGRLDTLLMTPAAGTSLLQKPAQRATKSASPASKKSTLPSFRTSSSDLVKQIASTEPPKNRFLPPRRRPSRGPEDEEPLRSRPVNRLNLSHFRLNPNINNGYDFAYDKTLRSKKERRCASGCTRPECCGGQMGTLADTLGPDANISEDDLLLYLLGQGSEDKIRALTDVARENLLHEARAKRVADAFGRHKKVHHRAEDPTGFWNVEMPGSQEERSNREESKRRERDEVENRYREACKDGSRWVFADE